MFLTNPESYPFGARRRNITSFRPLLMNEKIAGDDMVEDLFSGQRVKVKGSFYGFLIGQRAAGGRELPGVNDIVRP